MQSSSITTQDENLAAFTSSQTIFNGSAKKNSLLAYIYELGNTTFGSSINYLFLSEESLWKYSQSRMPITTFGHLNSPFNSWFNNKYFFQDSLDSKIFYTKAKTRFLGKLSPSFLQDE